MNPKLDLNLQEQDKEELMYFFTHFLLLDFFFFLILQFFLLRLPDMHLTVLCCTRPYFFWFWHMSIAEKMFSCPRIQHFLIILVVRMKYIVADCVNPPVTAFAISTVNPMAVSLNIFRGFVLYFANLANLGIKT